MVGPFDKKKIKNEENRYLTQVHLETTQVQMGQ